MEYFLWTAWLALIGFLMWRFSPLLIHSIRLEQSPGWPTAPATIFRGTTGAVDAGRDFITPAAFMTYRYSVNGAQFEGKFVITQKPDMRLRTTKNSLIGAVIDVRYDPRKPATSILNDFHDKRFNALGASQNPEFLRQESAGSIEDIPNSI